MFCRKSGQANSVQCTAFDISKERMFFPFVALIILLTVSIGKTTAAEFDQAYIPRLWQAEDGLPQNMVQAVTQTRDDYIWVGTKNGLARFDGIRFTVFDSGNTPGLRNNSITCLYEDTYGTLWIGTDGAGLTYYKDGVFSRYTVDDGLVGNFIKSVFEASNGVHWIATTDGVSHFSNGQFSTFRPENWPTNAVVRNFLEDERGRIWISANAAGLLLFESGKLTRHDEASTINPKFKRTVRYVYQDRNKEFWIGALEDGFRRMTSEGVTLEVFKRTGLAGIVNTIFQDQRGNVWVGTFDGLNRISEGKVFTQVNADGIPWDSVNAICEDKEGNIWAGTKEGLYQLRSRAFQAYTQNHNLAANNVMSMVGSQDGSLWIGTWGGGVNRLRDGKVIDHLSVKTMGLNSDLVLGMCESKDGTLWLGFEARHGMARWKEGILTTYRAAEGLDANAVRVIFEDRNTNLWIGTSTGLNLFQDGRFTHFTTEDGLGGPHIRVIFEDSAGDLWFGTNHGLTRRQNGEFYTFTEVDGLPDATFVALYEDKEGTLWIGTLKNGLFRFKDNKFVSYRQEHGLFQDGVFDILEDDYGNLWMTCLAGIYRVEKNALNDLASGKVKSFTSIYYGKSEGLITVECSVVAKPSAYKANDGKLWFSTAKGVVFVDPKQCLEFNQKPPRVLVEQVMVDRKAVALQAGTVRVPPGAADIEIHYTALSYSVPEQNAFKYKLEGVDKDWIDVGTRRVAYYSQLRPGRYPFHVIGSNNDGVWTVVPATVTIELEPYFYQTTWFFAGCVGLAGFLALGFHRVRVRHLRARQQALISLVNERTKDLKAEITQRQNAQLEIDRVHAQLVETSRKAGMAEVASGVLHNVGNVLNSVNVAATCAVEQIRNSRHHGLKKVAAILQENSSDLPAFFAADSRGKQLPDYIAKLAEQISREQTKVAGELESVCKNIDHIRDIVAMQQDYARISGMLETVNLRDLLEDAIRMNDAALMRHEVTIIRQYEVVPLICSDKHKLLQIVINLIRNAKYACDNNPGIKQVIISLKQLPSELIQVGVIDNGIGIPPENLTRIFSHGFTTRSGGHGFGLHSSALAAKDLGGSLTAFSEGTGRGASFLLEIPIKIERS
jgi:ligand-binding sensor domain-containing protein/signal transduction histidine kinase